MFSITYQLYKGIRKKKFPAVSIWLFHINRIETQNDNVCLPFFWSWSGSWKTGANRIREHWFWRLRYLLHTSKCTFMSWLLDSLDLPSRRKDTHRLMSSADYGFNQWSVASFLIKKLYVYLYMLKLYVFSYTHVFHANIFSPFMIWKWIYRFCSISEFFVDPTRNVNYIEKQNSEKIQRVKIRLNLKTNDISLIISSNLRTLTLQSHVR